MRRIVPRTPQSFTSGFDGAMVPSPNVGPTRTMNLQRLRQRLAQPLPGLEAQRRMAPPGRVGDTYDPDPPGALASAVLLVVTGDERLVFIRRSLDGSPHSGQIAFPGGARERQDRNLAETALRETEEEIGLPQSLVVVLGRLSPVYITVSNFVVHPFVGFVESLPPLVPEPGEVAEILTAPIEAFANCRSTLSVARRGERYEAPCYRVSSVEVWGATAMITSEFLQVWRESQREATGGGRSLPHTSGGATDLGPASAAGRNVASLDGAEHQQGDGKKRKSTGRADPAD